MIKIDLKDRKILYQLDLDSRQSANQIARKVGLSKSVVNYRISRLKESGIIKNFYSLVDAIGIGFIPIRIHIKFQYTTSKIIKEIINFFVNDKLSTLVGSADGPFNLSVVIEVRDIYDFYNLWETAKNRYGYYFQSYNISFFINEMRFKSSYLLLNDMTKSERDNFIFIGQRKLGKIDQVDIDILRSISSNSRLSLLEMSKKMNLTPVAIKYRIKKLIERKIILGFKLDIDVNKIGYQKFKTYVQLRDYGLRKDLIGFIKNNVYLTNIDTNSGESDLELEFVLENINQLRDIMDDLTDRFSGILRNYDIISVVKLHKYVFFPEYY